jgi:hypothetical protein
MTDKDRMEFGKLLARLRAAYHVDLGKDTIAVYWEELRGFPIEELREACSVAIQRLKWFPKVAELIEVVVEGRPELEPVNRYLLEYDQAEAISPEDAKECLQRVYDRIGENAEPEVKAQLEGEAAEEFEKKRRKAKEKQRQLMN